MDQYITAYSKLPLTIEQKIQKLTVILHHQYIRYIFLTELMFEQNMYLNFIIKTAVI